jgi:hypothetical protein
MGGLGSIHGLVAMGFHGFPGLWCGLYRRLAICDLRLAVTLPRPWCGCGGALMEPWGGFEVALYSGVYAEYMPSLWLCGGFGWLCPAFLHSALHLRLCVASGWLPPSVIEGLQRVLSTGEPPAPGRRCGDQ